MQLVRSAVLALLLLSLASAAVAEEPRYKGRTAASWQDGLSDKDAATRLEAITALVAIGKDATNAKALAPKVSPLMEDADPMIRAKACRWLVTVMTDPKAIKAATEMLKADSFDVVAESAHGLAAAGAPAKDAMAAINAEIVRIDNLKIDDLTEKTPAGRAYLALKAARKSLAGQ